jgi:hypothetical protein
VSTLNSGHTGDASFHRVNELDALAGILPADRREALAALLTDEDVTTLKHLAEEGMGANTLRALASDLGYLESWALAATALPLPWPAPEGLALKFLAHHLWDPIRREAEPGHGMPETVAASLKADGLLRVVGPRAPGTVRRRLASWATLHRWRGLSPAFNTSVQDGPEVRRAGQCPPPSAQESAGGDPRGARPVARHLRAQPARRPARLRPAPDRLRLRRPPTLGAGLVAGRAD